MWLATTLLLSILTAPQPALPESQPVAQEYRSFGGSDLQELLFWPGATADAPLIAFVHGGGWSRGDMRTGLSDLTLQHWQAQGYAVASINYRLVPDATVEQQAADVAAAVADLRENASQLGFDAGRIVLAGHSAGAHLATLVATDPHYLEAQGHSVTDLRGVLALDGAAYDVARELASGGRMTRRTFARAFGEDTQRHTALSPVSHAALPNAGAFLILHVDRRSAELQGTALADALRDAGTNAELRDVPGRGMRGHREINRRIGDPDYPATAIVDEWLARVLR